jgi:hypothetical protein
LSESPGAARNPPSLGKVDPGLRAPETPLDLRAIGREARMLEQIGYDGLVVEETKDDPFVIMALAAQATSRLKLATSVAIAFPRSPTVTAMSAWTLQKLSGGRFTLGLGTQVRAHIERRFGLPWSAAGPWHARICPRRACGLGLLAERNAPRHRRAALQDQPDGAAVRSRPDRAAAHSDPARGGQCRDVRHCRRGGRWPAAAPVCTPSYIREVMLPAARAGAPRGPPHARAISASA